MEVSSDIATASLANESVVIPQKAALHTETPDILLTDKVDDDPGPEIPFADTFNEPSVFTRSSDPFNPDRMNHILQLVQIGSNLTKAQH